MWVEDDYHGSYDCDANPSANFCEAGGLAPTDGSAWVDTPRGVARGLRGGCWHGGPFSLRVANRATGRPYNDIMINGGRCAR